MKTQLQWISIRNIFTIGMVLLSFTLFSQSIAIGTNTPAASAILDVTSTDMGILVPRMTTTQRLMIEIPASGLLLFDNTTSTFWYNEMQGWKEMKSHWIQDGNNIYNSNSGNVGIGLTNPSVPLEVSGSIRSLRPGSSPNGSSISLASPDGDPGIIFTRGNGSGGELRSYDLKIDNDQSLRLLDHLAEMDYMVIDVNGNIGIGTSSPHASSVLEVASTIRGFLPPRMIQTQINAIATPVAGLMVWCSDCGDYGQMKIYNGSSWNEL